MKKRKKIWNRLLSLVLCLVMVTGMFAGMGMQADAATTYTGTMKLVNEENEAIAGAKLQPYWNDKYSNWKDTYIVDEHETTGSDGTAKFHLGSQEQNDRLLRFRAYDFPEDKGYPDEIWSTAKYENGFTGEWTIARHGKLYAYVTNERGTPIQVNTSGESFAAAVGFNSKFEKVDNKTGLYKTIDDAEMAKEYTTRWSAAGFTDSYEGTGRKIQAKYFESDSAAMNNSVPNVKLRLLEPIVSDANDNKLYSNKIALTAGSYSGTYKVVIPAGGAIEFSSTGNVDIVRSQDNGGYACFQVKVDDIPTTNPVLTITATHGSGDKKVSKERTITLEVAKKNPNATVEIPELTYGEYAGEVILKADCEGIFHIGNSKIEKIYNPGSSPVTFPVTDIFTIFNDNVGEHTLNYTFTPTGSVAYKYMEIDDGSAKYTVSPKSIKDAEVTIDVESFSYDGKAKTPSVESVKIGDKTLVEGTDYTVRYENNTNATNEAKVVITGIGNYISEEIETFEIVPALFQERGCFIFSIPDATYTGEQQKPQVKVGYVEAYGQLYNLDSTSDYEVTYENNIDAGLATVKVTGKGNYSGEIQRTFWIKQKPITVKFLNTSDIEKVYDGTTEVESSDTTNVLSSDDIEGNDSVYIGASSFEYADASVGDYKRVYAKGLTITGADSANYCIGNENNQAFAFIGKITPITLNVNVTIKNKQYDGTTEATIDTINLSGVLDIDKEKVDLVNGIPKFKEIGSADQEERVVVIFDPEFELSGEKANNYSLEQPQNVYAYIENNYIAEFETDYLVNSHDWINVPFEVTATEGNSISLGSTLEYTWGVNLSASETDEDGKGSLTFYVKNKDGHISKKVTENYQIDTEPPVGTIEINENSWGSFLEKVTLGLFYNHKYDVAITASDRLSGVKSIEYLELATKESEGYTLLDLNALSDDAWTKVENDSVTFSTMWEAEKTYIYYARITDCAGNVKYICSHNGIEYDVTEPVISGVTDKQIAYTAQKVVVTDRNLDTVKVNGETMSDSFTLAGNVAQETTYTIVATDKAGNGTTVTVTMKPLSDLSDDITDNNVTLEDEKELKKSEELLKEALKEDNLSNLTVEEEAAIRGKLEVIQNLLQDIAEVKEVISLLESLPSAYLKDGETVNPYVSDRMDDEDEGLYSAVKAAYSAYKKLSAHQQSLISTSLKHNLSNLRKILTDYRIIDGDGKVWVYDTNGTLTFIANGPVCRFENALVDGKKVPAEEMKVTKGSTVVELDAGYLYRLGLGDHTFQMVYEDGKTDVAEFSIVTMEEYNAMMNQPTGTNQTGTGAATGDSANVLLWGAALAVGAVGIVVAKKKRKNEEA